MKNYDIFWKIHELGGIKKSDVPPEWNHIIDEWIEADVLELKKGIIRIVKC